MKALQTCVNISIRIVSSLPHKQLLVLPQEIELLSQADIGSVGVSSAAAVQQEMAKLQEQVEAYTRKIEGEKKRVRSEFSRLRMACYS